LPTPPPDGVHAVVDDIEPLQGLRTETVDPETISTV
jgi:hypothetical protein